MVLFALASLLIIGMAGLALDAGLSYLGQTGLQSASDNASLAVARMLAVDYSSENQVPAPGTPWGYSTIVSTVNHIVGANGAGSTRATSYQAYFTDGSGTKICQFWPTAQATCPAMFSLSGGLPEASGVLSASGALVIPTNTHKTNVLDVLGIVQVSETAPATAIFGVVKGISAVSVGYAVYDIYCPTGHPLAVGEQITYYSPQWKKAWPCANLGDANFKGDLHSPSPDPLIVPGWISGKSGSAAITPVKAGHTIVVPMIDCVDHGSQCTEPVSPGVCPASLPAGLPTSGNDVMCAVGLIAIKAITNCSTGSTCTGQVVSFPSSQGGILICPTIANPTCGNEIGTQGSESTYPELLK
ncbi:MAG TPA: Tad domain-containing protein [Candidatus Dormibacteraeota bacterium]|nr:Tad domain-containing protein [Candidatus Dormibacteraeota bacterium]